MRTDFNIHFFFSSKTYWVGMDSLQSGGSAFTWNTGEDLDSTDSRLAR